MGNIETNGGTLLGGATDSGDDNPAKINPRGNEKALKPSTINIESTPSHIRDARENATHNMFFKTQLEESAKHLSSIVDEVDPLDTEAIANRQNYLNELSTIIISDMNGGPNDAQLLVLEIKRFQRMDDKEYAAEAKATRRALTQRDGGLNDLKLVRKFIAKDPRVQKFLNDTGLGNSQKVTERIIELARANAIRNISKDNG